MVAGDVGIVQPNGVLADRDVRPDALVVGLPREGDVPLLRDRVAAEGGYAEVLVVAGNGRVTLVRMPEAKILQQALFRGEELLVSAIEELLQAQDVRVLAL